MRPRVYDQDAHGRRLCPRCGRPYERHAISRHVRSCTGAVHDKRRAFARSRAAGDLAAVLPGPYAAPWRCARCADDLFAPSVADPRYCQRCAPRRYAWRRVVFGNVRIVPPREAARW